MRDAQHASHPARRPPPPPPATALRSWRTSATPATRAGPSARSPRRWAAAAARAAAGEWLLVVASTRASRAASWAAWTSGAAAVLLPRSLPSAPCAAACVLHCRRGKGWGCAEIWCRLAPSPLVSPPGLPPCLHPVPLPRCVPSPGGQGLWQGGHCGALAGQRPRGAEAAAGDVAPRLPGSHVRLQLLLCQHDAGVGGWVALRGGAAWQVCCQHDAGARFVGLQAASQAGGMLAGLARACSRRRRRLAPHPPTHPPHPRAQACKLAALARAPPHPHPPPPPHPTPTPPPPPHPTPPPPPTHPTPTHPPTPASRACCSALAPL